MIWTFRLRGKEISLTSVEEAAAVRPTPDLLGGAGARSAVARRFGAPATDDGHRGRFGLDLPARNRRIFEQAGWVFVEPEAAVARAAAFTTARLDDAQAVQEVYLDRAGNIQVTSDVVTLQLEPGVSEGEARRRMDADGLELIRAIPFAPNTFEARATEQRPLRELIDDLQSKPYYLFAEPMLLQAITGRLKPADPRYANQWQHFNDGGNNGAIGADVHAEGAWDRTRGRGDQRPVRIAVIDNGMQVTHPDLRDGVIGAGYFQSTGLGTANFVRFPAGGGGFPDESHGTFCMGMAGARMNNNRGGCGVAPEADLLAIACLGDQIGTQVTLARAVAYAADPSREDGTASPADGADVITCSLGPNGADWDLTSVLDLAIRFAANQGRAARGVPIFWAVSNGHFEVARDEVSSHPDVIAVGRSNRRDRADGSAFGSELAFLAPGRDVYNTRSGGGYRFWTGTSFAAPLAAGVGALVLARYPQFTAQQVRQRLRDTCDKIGNVQYNQGHHDEYGFGRINAEQAVE